MDLDEAIKMVIKEMDKENEEYAKKARRELWKAYADLDLDKPSDFR